MNFSARLRAGLLAGACTIVGVCAAAPAYSQVTPPSAEDCAKDSTLAGCATAPQAGAAVTGQSVATTTASDAPSSGEIIVTGTNIRVPTLTSPVPVTSISASNLLATGNLSIGDALNNLPALRGTFSQANSTQFIGTSGVNFLDLRGLGVSRTLVLVDGRRHVTSSPGDYLVDTNTIPDDLLERVRGVELDEVRMQAAK